VRRRISAAGTGERKAEPKAVGLAQDQTRDKAQGWEDPQRPLRKEEPVYSARISLDRTQMQVENKLVNLSPSMAVTVEIKTGSRTIISYLLSPLRK
jgi:hemolysin D